MDEARLRDVPHWEVGLLREDAAALAQATAHATFTME